MIIVKNSGFLKYKNFKMRCALGKGGIGVKKKEGDNITPKGVFKITKIYYRNDKIKKIVSKIKKIIIKKKMIWCDDPKSIFYNKQINLPCKFSYEKLYRNDHIYDLLAVLNYNTNPVKKNKGSAIFLHISKKKFKPTAGCIALKKKDLLFLLSKTTKKTKIKIG